MSESDRDLSGHRERLKSGRPSSKNDLEIPVHLVEIILEFFRLEATDHAFDRLDQMFRELALLGFERLFAELLGKMNLHLDQAFGRTEAAKV